MIYKVKEIDNYSPDIQIKNGRYVINFNDLYEAVNDNDTERFTYLFSSIYQFDSLIELNNNNDDEYEGENIYDTLLSKINFSGHMEELVNIAAKNDNYKIIEYLYNIYSSCIRTNELLFKIVIENDSINVLHILYKDFQYEFLHIRNISKPNSKCYQLLFKK